MRGGADAQMHSKAEDGRQRAEDRGRKTEDGRQRTEDRSMP